MLADRFDESMVLLAQLLCWPLDHVKSLKLNARKAAFKVDLSTQERNALKQWQQGDTMLYQHFERIFNQKVLGFLLDFPFQKLDENPLDLRIRP